MILAIDTKSGRIALDGSTLPGTVTRIYVKGALLFESTQETGSSKTEKVLTGFDDAEIAINTEILDEGNEDKSRYQLLKKLNGMFRAVENGSPVTYRVDNPHLAARGISQVLFNTLESTDEDGYIACVLSFVEHEKKVAKQESTQAKNSTPSTTTTTTKSSSLRSPNRQRAIKAMQTKYGSSK